MLIAVEFWTESDVTEYYSHLLYSAHSLFHLNTAENQSLSHVALVPLTYVAMASAVSLSGSMVMRRGVRSGRDFILSEGQENKEIETNS